MRIDTHSLEVHQRGDLLQLDADRAVPVAEDSYRWHGELRLWDNEALIGCYRSTDAAVRSKGALYLALHPHGTNAWGRWVGMSYDGLVITGWGA
ncbi:MAG: transcriptional regulator, partial [Actinobacteria bacterium]|nr:transcriptional regulator [Actinomycetota bacterium]